MPARLRPLGAAALVAALALAGCTGGDEAGAPRPPASPATSSTASAASAAESSTGVAVDPSPPPEGGCYRLRYAELAEPTSDSPPVPCSADHNAQTIFVGELDTVVDGHLVAVDSAAVQEQVAEECPRHLAEHLGGSRSARALSRFEVVWFSPTVAQSDAGANWFRCDLVALAAPERLADLPAPRRLAGLLDRPGALREYGLCGTAAPGAPRFERVICSRPHSWAALAVIPIGGGARYPGQRAVRQAGDDVCRERVRRAEGSPMRFRYGWEWPTAEQWKLGQRYGYCWAPD